MKGILFNCFIILLILQILAHGCARRIQGTPVKEMPSLRLNTEVDSEKSLSMSHELARISKVTENRIFTEERGYPEYKVGPLDILEITSRIGSEHSLDTVIVRSDGTISYSFIDDFPVEGLTVSEIDERLTERLSAFIRTPRIDIVVKEFKSKSALVMGEIGSLRYAQNQAVSGRIYLKGKTTLLDLLVMAGGYTKDADIKKVKLIRGDNIFYINLYDLIYRGEVEQNVIIDDGDVIDVPELPEYGERVYVLGEVNNQGIYSLKDVPDLLAALSFAGSYTETGIEENTLIIRDYKPGQKPLILTADIGEILKKGDISQNIPLKDGDIVYVPRSIIGDINEFIINTVPLLDYLLYPGKYRDAYGSYDHLRFKD
jgi:protein involved in polysaccharide export with SLBB domain